MRVKEENGTEVGTKVDHQNGPRVAFSVIEREYGERERERNIAKFAVFSWLSF